MKSRGLMLLSPRDPWFISPPAHTFSYLLITDFSWYVQEQQDSGFTRGSGCLVSRGRRFAKAALERHNTVQFALIYYAISGGYSSVRCLWETILANSVLKADFILRHLNSRPGFLYQFQYKFCLKTKVTSTHSQGWKSWLKTTKLGTIHLNGWLSCNLTVLGAMQTQSRDLAYCKATVQMFTMKWRCGKSSHIVAIKNQTHMGKVFNMHARTTINTQHARSGWLLPIPRPCHQVAKHRVNITLQKAMQFQLPDFLCNLFLFSWNPLFAAKFSTPGPLKTWIRKMTKSPTAFLLNICSSDCRWIKGVRARQLLEFFSDGYSEVSEHAPAPTAYWMCPQGSFPSLCHSQQYTCFNSSVHYWKPLTEQIILWGRIIPLWLKKILPALTETWVKYRHRERKNWCYPWRRASRDEQEPFTIKDGTCCSSYHRKKTLLP